MEGMRMKRKTKVILIVCIVAIIVGCVLLLPLPKKISVNMPAVGKNDGGYLTNTSISWEGWYLNYLIRRDRIEGVFTLNAGTKKEIVIPTERDLYFGEHKIAGLMEMVNWMTRDEMHNFYRTEIWFNKAFDSIVVIDDVMGTFVAPATNEAEACAIIERIPLYLKDWEG